MMNHDISWCPHDDPHDDSSDDPNYSNDSMMFPWWSHYDSNDDPHNDSNDDSHNDSIGDLHNDSNDDPNYSNDDPIMIPMIPNDSQ